MWQQLVQNMNSNAQISPNCKNLRPKSMWKSTRRRWVQMKSDSKALPSSLPTHVNQADNQGYENSYNVETQQLRLFVGTWNVAGKSPTDKCLIEEWLNSQEAADIYVIGFQEIVPLSTGNVLANEHKGFSATKWDELITETLNGSGRSGSYPFGCSGVDSELIKSRRTSFSTTPSSPCSTFGGWCRLTCEDMASNISEDALPTSTLHNFYKSLSDVNGRRHSSADISDLDWDTNSPFDLQSSSPFPCSTMPHMPNREYVKIASKQFVGLFISVWLHGSLCHHLKALDISTVGCGILGRLGNKGAISVSLSVHETNFCFVCTHLASGDRHQDLVRRNSDIDNILKRTKFHHSKRWASFNLPKTILGHDQIIWFGDLNYRLDMPLEDLKLLMAKKDWGALLQRDQLKHEQGRGGILDGWIEGPINFPPTYKFLPNSDEYLFMQQQPHQKSAQKRAPAWCDRIIWYGKGLKQLYYKSNPGLRYSDHRPVSASFIAEVEVCKTIST